MDYLLSEKKRLEDLLSRETDQVKKRKIREQYQAVCYEIKQELASKK